MLSSAPEQVIIEPSLPELHTDCELPVSVKEEPREKAVEIKVEPIVAKVKQKASSKSPKILPRPSLLPNLAPKLLPNIKIESSTLLPNHTILPSVTSASVLTCSTMLPIVSSTMLPHSTVLPSNTVLPNLQLKCEETAYFPSDEEEETRPALKCSYPSEKWVQTVTTSEYIENLEYENQILKREWENLKSESGVVVIKMW